MRRPISEKEKAQNRHDYLRRQEAITRRARAFWKALPEEERRRRNKAAAEKAKQRAAIDQQRIEAAAAEKAWRFAQHRRQRETIAAQLADPRARIITLQQLRNPHFKFRYGHHIEKERL
jgi:hypothetical protein